MAEELIDSYIDRNGIKGDTEFILADLNKVLRAFREIEGIKIDMRGFDGLGKISPALSQAKAGADSLAEATKTVEARIASMNGKSKEFTDVLLKQTKAQKEAANASLANAKAKQIEERLTKSLAKEKENLNKEALKEANNAAKLSNEYEQLKAKYTIAANTAKQLAAAKGLDNEETKEAIAQAQKYYASLINIEKAVGQSQRQVGQYTQATFALTQVIRETPAFANSFATGISAISNNLPLLIDQYKNLSGQIGRFNAFKVLASSLLSFTAILPIAFLLIQSYGKEIGDFFKRLVSGGDAFNAMKEAQKAVNAAMKEGVKAANESVGELRALYEISQDTTQSIEDRKDATKRILEINKENNEKTGESIKLLTDQNGILKAQPELIDKISESLIRQAKTKAVLQTIEEAYTKLITAQTASLTSQTTKLEDALGSSLNKVGGLLNSLNPLRGIINVKPVDQAARQQKLKDQGVADAQSYLDATKKILSEGLKSGDLDLSGLIENGGAGGGSEDAKKKLKEEQDRRLQVLSELRAIEIQADIDFYKAQTENENLSLVERLQALQKYYQSRIALVNLNADTEKQLGEKTSEELVLVEAKRADELRKLNIETYKERDRLINEFSKKFTEDQKKAYDATDKVIQDAYKRYIDIEKKRTEIEKELAEERIKKAKEEAEQKKRLQQQLVTELLNLAQTLGTASIEREKNAVQEQIDQLEAKKQKDIEVANQTIANAQDRTAAIQVIEARAAAQREQLERRQRELDVKKAQFDKARSIANIIQETATNIVKYFGTPLALLAGAIGAVQLATVIAQPIPRYKHGKNANDLYEGPAIVDDGGKPEAIIREDGSVEIGGNTPRLTYVKKRDVVLPDANQLIDYVLAGHMGGRLQITPQQKAENGTKRLEDKLDSVVEAIKAQPKTSVRANESGLVSVIKFGASQLKYLNDNVNW